MFSKVERNDLIRRNNALVGTVFCCSAAPAVALYYTMSIYTPNL